MKFCQKHFHNRPARIPSKIYAAAARHRAIATGVAAILRFERSAELKFLLSHYHYSIERKWSGKLVDCLVVGGIHILHFDGLEFSLRNPSSSPSVFKINGNKIDLCQGPAGLDFFVQ